jgi:hypothetical protein
VKYETQRDLNNEKWVIDYLSKTNAWANYKFHKLDPKYSLDYALCEHNKPTIKGWAEIKCYKVPYAKYPRTMLSMYKCTSALAIMDVSAQPFYHFVKYSDGVVCWKQITKKDMNDVKWGGRKVERHKGNGDQEPIFYFDKKEYSILVKDFIW